MNNGSPNICGSRISQASTQRGKGGGWGVDQLIIKPIFGYNFCTAIARNFMFGTQIHLGRDVVKF